MKMMFVPHSKHAYGPPWPVMEIALLLISTEEAMLRVLKPTLPLNSSDRWSEKPGGPSEVAKPCSAHKLASFGYKKALHRRRH
jgi:hypothetical protein